MSAMAGPATHERRDPRARLVARTLRRHRRRRFGFGLVIALRAISGLDLFQTEQTGYPHVIVPAITAPLGFL